jgi:YjbE family integral membrane protein
MEFIASLLTIVLLDLLLAGDNALVIGAAASRLDPTQRKRAILWGTGFALVIRVIATICVTYLLQNQWLMLLGAAGLVYVAWGLISDVGDDEAQGNSVGSTSLAAAMKAIVIADVVMSVDNVLGVGAAAHGNTILVVTGLALSVPIMVWGSTIVATLVAKHKWLIVLGVASLVYTAVDMLWKAIPTSHPVNLAMHLVAMGAGTSGLYALEMVTRKK